jgi:maltose-binding protein MalE
MSAMQEAGGRGSAFTSVNEAIEDPELRAFAEAGAAGQPMPNIPEMSAIWSAWGSAMALIGQGQSTAAEALPTAQEQVEAALADQ